MNVRLTVTTLAIFTSFWTTVTEVKAQELVTYFNFEDSTNSTPDLTSDQPPGAQASTITLGLNFVSIGDVPGGIAANVAPGDPDANNRKLAIILSGGVNASATFTFGVSTQNLGNFALSFATDLALPNNTLLITGSYSLNGGGSYISSGVSSSSVNTGSGYVETLTFPSAVDNQASQVLFRISMTNTGVPGFSMDMDNIQLNSVPEPATWFAASLVTSLLAARCFRRAQRRAA